MQHVLKSTGWQITLRDICELLFDVLTFIWPGLTLLALVVLVGWLRHS